MTYKELAAKILSLSEVEQNQKVCIVDSMFEIADQLLEEDFRVTSRIEQPGWADKQWALFPSEDY